MRSTQPPERPGRWRATQGGESGRAPPLDGADRERELEELPGPEEPLAGARRAVEERRPELAEGEGDRPGRPFEVAREGEGQGLLLAEREHHPLRPLDPGRRPAQEEGLAEGEPQERQEAGREERQEDGQPGEEEGAARPRPASPWTRREPGRIIGALPPVSKILRRMSSSASPSISASGVRTHAVGEDRRRQLLHVVRGHEVALRAAQRQGAGALEQGQRGARPAPICTASCRRWPRRGRRM